MRELTILVIAGLVAAAAADAQQETVIGAMEECESAGGLALTEEWRYAPPETSPADRLFAMPSSVARHPEAGVSCHASNVG